MKFNYKSLVVVSAMAFLMVGGCSPKPETLVDKYDEKKMEQAISEARSSFDEFLTRFRNPQTGDEAFHVKVRIEDGNGIEHFWVGDLKLDAEPYSGTIGNEPGIVKKVKHGQNYSFSRSEISDWMYMSNGKMQGNYTLRVELESMSPKEAQTLKRKVGW